MNKNTTKEAIFIMRNHLKTTACEPPARSNDLSGLPDVRILLVFCIIAMGSIVAILSRTRALVEDSHESTLQTEYRQQKQSEVFGVNRSVELRVQANIDSPRLVNQKATAIFGKTHFKLIDPSTTVRVLQQKGVWSEIQIVEPAWLSSDRGWVPTDALRVIVRTADGKRTYVEDDFYWDTAMRPWKSEIIFNVNKISRENSDCYSLDPYTTSLSASRSTPSNPVFYVTCSSSAGVPFNIWFSIH